ncbi:MAG TPA: SDR family NAD(P)-dependent oxidoreductase [Acidimicrobiia bacterium]|nr:SDR family NAD(P)-dependent oxidoreductase [Acidimicrobiia bacterium]
MRYPLEGKKVLVTGASSGIGAALARALAERGAIVGLCARREGRLSDVLLDCRRHSPDSRMWVVDLAELDSVGAFAEKADDEMGGIDVLVNNAGIPKRRRAATLSWDDVESVAVVNYLSPVRMTLALLPRMLERGGGRIVNISSVAARLSPPGESVYAASKAALSAFSESMAVELWEEPVDIHVVYPGVIDTELFHLPGNDPSFADIEPLPPAALAEAIIGQLDSGAFELWLPEWMRDVAAGKPGDIEGYLAGAAAYLKERETASE